MYHSDNNNNNNKNYAKSPLSWNGKAVVSYPAPGKGMTNVPAQPPNQLVQPYYSVGPYNGGPPLPQGSSTSNIPLPMGMEYQYQQNLGNNLPPNSFHDSHIIPTPNSNYNLGYPIENGNNALRNFVLSPVQNVPKNSGAGNNQQNGNNHPGLHGGIQANPSRLYELQQSNEKSNSLHSFIPRKTQESIPSIDSLKADIGSAGPDRKSPESVTNESVSNESIDMHSPFGNSKSKRSRKGCLTCRQRKKRCCETKPRCQECDRLGLNCRWPAPGTENKNRSKNNKFMSHDEMKHEFFGTIKILRGIVDYKIEG